MKPIIRAQGKLLPIISLLLLLSLISLNRTEQGVTGQVKDFFEGHGRYVELDTRENHVVSVFPGGKAVQLAYRASKAREVLTQKNKLQEVQAQANKVQEIVLQGLQTVLPVFGEVTSGYGPRIHPITKQYEIHQGIDIAAPKGAVVRAVAAGTVETGQSAGFGNYVIIKHNSTLETLYGHLDKIYTPSGTVVAAGEAIGTVGSTGLSTGSHLHFEVIVNHKAVDPLREAAGKTHSFGGGMKGGFLF